jgi:multisubunit Na+/H+ antiporter MnhE subunit
MRAFLDGATVVAGAFLGLAAVVWLLAGLRSAITGGHSIFGQVVAMIFVVAMFRLLARQARWLRRRGQRS